MENSATGTATALTISRKNALSRSRTNPNAKGKWPDQSTMRVLPVRNELPAIAKPSNNAPRRNPGTSFRSSPDLPARHAINAAKGKLDRKRTNKSSLNMPSSFLRLPRPPLHTHANQRYAGKDRQYCTCGRAPAAILGSCRKHL